MSAGEGLQFEDVSTSVLSSLTFYARLDLGLDPLKRDVPGGQEFADALRLQVIAWGSETDYPRALVNEVYRLATVTADLVERAGRG